jgi:hypothetical protein
MAFDRVASAAGRSVWNFGPVPGQDAGVPKEAAGPCC